MRLPCLFGGGLIHSDCSCEAQDPFGGIQGAEWGNPARVDGFSTRGFPEGGDGEETVRDGLAAVGILKATDKSARVELVQQAPDFLVQELAVVFLILGTVKAWVPEEG